MSSSLPHRLKKSFRLRCMTTHKVHAFFTTNGLLSRVPLFWLSSASRGSGSLSEIWVVAEKEIPGYFSASSSCTKIIVRGGEFSHFLSTFTQPALLLTRPSTLIRSQNELTAQLDHATVDDDQDLSVFFLPADFRGFPFVSKAYH